MHSIVPYPKHHSSRTGGPRTGPRTVGGMILAVALPAAALLAVAYPVVVLTVLAVLALEVAVDRYTGVCLCRADACSAAA